MAIGIRIKLAGVTQEQYDAAHTHINPDRSVPKGMLYHASGPIEGGWGVIDFWESSEAFDRFTQQQLMPALQQLGERGFPSPPEREHFTVHNVEQHGD